MFTVKRIYEPASGEDGHRYLVDRLWPRGLGKDKARLDGWLKEISPSTGLREWFHHEPDKWEEFKKRYYRELSHPGLAEDLDGLRRQGKQGRVTLLYAAKDEEHNNAVALKEYLEKETS